MKQQDRLEQLQRYLRTRNLYGVRELLIENLSDFSEDKEFLMICYHLVKQDALVFQTHDHELLEPNLEKWNEAAYQGLVQKLTKNFSQMRYYLCLQLSLYFYKLKKDETQLLEKELKEEPEEELEENIRRKTIGIHRLFKKRRRRRKRKLMSDKEKHIIGGIETTGFLLVWLIVQLILSN